MNKVIRAAFCLLSVAGCLTSAAAWEPTPADLEEAFLLWSTPRSEYAGRPQEEAYALLTADSAAGAMVGPKFLGSPSGSVRDKILTLCENLGASSVGPAFRPHAIADSPSLSIVMFCLSRSKDTGSLPILLEHLTHPRPSIRSAAALSIGYLGRNDAVDSLIQRIQADTAASVRKSAVFALGKCVDSSTVTRRILDVLTASLDDEFFSARFNAARALGSLADPAVEHLQAKYDGLSDTGKYGALVALSRAPNGAGRTFLEKVIADPGAPQILRAAALKGLLDQKRNFADTELADLRAMPAGKGQFGLIR